MAPKVTTIEVPEVERDEAASASALGLQGFRAAAGTGAISGAFGNATFLAADDAANGQFSGTNAYVASTGRGFYMGAGLGALGYGLGLGLRGALGRTRASLTRKAAAASDDAVQSPRNAGTSEICRGGVCVKPCFVAGTLVAISLGAVPIEALSVGDRVQTHQRSSQTAFDDSWRSVQLVLADEDNPLHLFNVTLLRPADWWASLGIEEVGDELFFELEELNVRGWSRVVEINSGIEIASGSGRVVTMTINHLNNDVYQVGFGDRVAPLRGTGRHPLYSLDRDRLGAGS